MLSFTFIHVDKKTLFNYTFGKDGSEVKIHSEGWCKTFEMTLFNFLSKICVIFLT